MATVMPQEFALNQEQLAQAFGAFSSAAQVLERSYFGLGQEVNRLRRELEQERDLRRRREALAEVSAVVAHEIRNPLGSMELFTGLLTASELPQRERQWVEQIQSGIRIISATANNILEFYGGDHATVEPVELHSTLRSAQALLAPVAERAGVRWQCEFHSDELWMPADRRKFEQVFLNLALNVFRFAAEGGVLRVATKRENGCAVLTFEDRGPGIAPEILARLFQAGATTRAGGTGLGLAVAKRIVESHDGTIEVASTPGQGTAFLLRLPLMNAAVGEAVPAELAVTSPISEACTRATGAHA